MADVIITFKIMPAGVETDLEVLKTTATDMIAKFGGEVGKSSEEPVAFGLKALILIFVMDEGLGSTESLELEIQGLESVNSVDVTDVRRALG